MKKVCTWVMLVGFLLAVVGSAAAQQGQIGAKAGIGTFRFNGESSFTSGQWLGGIEGEFSVTEDLRVEGQWVGGFARTMTTGGETYETGFTASPWRGHGALGYLIFDEDGVQLYGGLSYEIARMALANNDAGIPSQSFFGRGFGLHGHASILLTPELGATASIHGTPWFTWEYTQGSSARKDIKGSSFAYQLEIAYSVYENIALTLGYNGHRSSVDSFTFVDGGPDIGKSSGVFSGVTFGASISF